MHVAMAFEVQTRAILGAFATSGVTVSSEDLRADCRDRLPDLRERGRLGIEEGQACSGLPHPVA